MIFKFVYIGTKIVKCLIFYCYQKINTDEWIIFSDEKTVDDDKVFIRQDYSIVELSYFFLN